MKKYIFFLSFLLIGFQTFAQGLSLHGSVQIVGNNCGTIFITGGTSGKLSISATSSVKNINLKLTGDLLNSGLLDIATCPINLLGTNPQNIANSGNTIVDNILVNNTSGLTLNSPTVIRRLLTLNGNMVSNGNLILHSDATNTAMLVNTNGIVTGNATQQRYIDGTYNGVGYHYLSSPVQSANITTTFASKMNLICNQTFNNSPDPAYTNPFPTFYYYDESKAGFVKGTAPNQYDAFMAAWQVPDCSGNMTVARGYIANIAKGQTIEYQGVLNNGNLNIALSKGSTGTERGWNLVGNPYPSPVEWSKILALSSNVDNAIYQRIATGQYSGIWASYVNGIGINGGSDKIALGQAFMARCNNTTGGNLVFNNTVRVTSYENPSFFRSEDAKSEKTGLVKLILKGNSSADETAVYFEKNATADFDSKYDAAKVQTNAGVTLYTRIGEQKISINGQANFETETQIPLIFYVPQNGNYTFETNELSHFGAKTEIYLEDKSTNKLVDLRQNKSYSFSANTGTDANRFVLRFSKPLSELQAENIILYPNPTADYLKIRFLNNYEGEVKIKVLDLQGRVFQTFETKKSKGVFEQNLKVMDLSKGVYLLDIQTLAGKLTKKFLKE